MITQRRHLFNLLHKVNVAADNSIVPNGSESLNPGLANYSRIRRNVTLLNLWIQIINWQDRAMLQFLVHHSELPSCRTCTHSGSRQSLGYLLGKLTFVAEHHFDSQLNNN